MNNFKKLRLYISKIRLDIILFFINIIFLLTFVIYNKIKWHLSSDSLITAIFTIFLLTWLCFIICSHRIGISDYIKNSKLFGAFKSIYKALLILEAGVLLTILVLIGLFSLIPGDGYWFGTPMLYETVEFDNSDIYIEVYKTVEDYYGNSQIYSMVVKSHQYPQFEKQLQMNAQFDLDSDVSYEFKWLDDERLEITFMENGEKHSYVRKPAAIFEE